MYKRKKHGYGRGHYHHSRAVFIRAAGDVAYYEYKLYNTPIYKLLDYQSVMSGYPLSRLNRIAKRLGRLIRLNQPVPRWMSKFVAPTSEEDSRAKVIINVWPYEKEEDENEGAF